ncbi:MAG: hypothetical protein ACP5E3_20365, partial [Bacteroidales bacterium]
NSTLPDLHHGSSSYSRPEIKERYDYLLPFYINDAIRQIRFYNSTVSVEIDVTEPERALIGLMPLQESKIFWMNNGASSYGDYSNYRSKSMRTVINEYAPFFPKELFTYAVYPHSGKPYFHQRYHLNTTLIAGHGFWGNLELLSEEQRMRVRKHVSKYHLIQSEIESAMVEVEGKIGASPEVYNIWNEGLNAGLVVMFSGSTMNYEYYRAVKGENILAVLNHAYTIENDILKASVQFSMPDDTRELFVLPTNPQNDWVRITSSSTWIDNVEVNDKEARIYAGGKGDVIVLIRQEDKWKEMLLKTSASKPLVLIK